MADNQLVVTTGKFDPDTIGERDDRVRLVLAGSEVYIAESWEVKCSIFTQPAGFSLRMGNAAVLAELIRKYPPRTPFQLFIGKALQQTGRTDAPGAEDSAGGSEFSVRGRDALSPLHDDLIADESNFSEPTYLELVKKQLKEVGLGDRTVTGSNRANREIKAGVKLQELLPPRTVDQILTDAAPSGTTSGIVHQSVQAKLGERRYEFLKRYLDLAGLFLWAAADGNFILSEPNVNQKPAFRIQRRLSDTRDTTNVKRGSFEDATEHRFSEYSVYGRGAGKKGGHPKALGTFVDSEMVNWGFKKTKTIRAARARTKEQAEFIARRHAAEDRRQGSKLRYVMSGSSTPSLNGSRLIYGVDMLCEVDDEIYGFRETFYVSDVAFRRSPQTETELLLTRPQDLVFGPLGE